MRQSIENVITQYLVIELNLPLLSNLNPRTAHYYNSTPQTPLEPPTRLPSLHPLQVTLPVLLRQSYTQELWNRSTPCLLITALPAQYNFPFVSGSCPKPAPPQGHWSYILSSHHCVSAACPFCTHFFSSVYTHGQLAHPRRSPWALPHCLITVPSFFLIQCHPFLWQRFTEHLFIARQRAKLFLFYNKNNTYSFSDEKKHINFRLST